MPCDQITGGYTRGCKTWGGIDTVYLTEKFNIVSYSANTSETIVGITLSGSSKFYTFDQIKETSSYTSNGTDSSANQNSSYVHTLNLKFFKGDTATRRIIKTLGANSLVAIVKERSGIYKILGLDLGLDRATANYNSGTALTDANGYEVTFTSNEKFDAYEVSSSIIPNIIA